MFLYTHRGYIEFRKMEFKKERENFMSLSINPNLFGAQQGSFLPSGLTPYIEGRYSMDISSILSGAKRDLYGEILSSSNAGERISFDVKFPNQPTRSFSSIEDAYRYCDKNYLPALEARGTTIKSQIEDLIKKQGLLEQAKKSGQLSSDKLKLADDTLAKIAERLNKLNTEYSGILQKKQGFLNLGNIASSTSGIFPSSDPNAYGAALNKNPISQKHNSTVFPSKNGSEYGRMLTENPVRSKFISSVFPSKNGSEYGRMLAENPIGNPLSQVGESVKSKTKFKGLKIGKFFKGKGGKLAGATAAVALAFGGYNVYSNYECSRLEKLLQEKNKLNQRVA